jgi:hypothetical protein
MPGHGNSFPWWITLWARREAPLARPVTTIRKRGRRATTNFNPRLVTELREAIGRLMGKKRASRELFAKLVESSPGSIYNWERGATEPNRHYLVKLHELKEKAASGELKLSSGGGRKAAGRPTTKDGPRVRHDTARTSEPVPVPSSELRAAPSRLYANSLTVEAEVNGKQANVWFRFDVTRPGSDTKEPVVEIVVPAHVFRNLPR